MFGTALKKMFGSSNDRRLKGYQPKIAAINALEAEFAALSDEELRAKTAAFRAEIAAGKSLNELLAPAFAAVREAAKRTLKQRHFNVQLIGGMVLHKGAIAEMRTGEGKTLVATLAVYLNALAGKGVHVVTVNDYLASRNSEWMGQIYRFLGMSVGVIVHGLDDDERRRSYAADITYGTNNEFGFDYLRDNMKYDMSQMVQRGHEFAIVDEVDFHPGRRSAHAADHFRSVGGSLGSLCQRERVDSAAVSRGLRYRRKAAYGEPDRGRQRTRRGAAAIGRDHEGRLALRSGQRDAGSSREPGAARA